MSEIHERYPKTKVVMFFFMFIWTVFAFFGVAFLIPQYSWMSWVIPMVGLVILGFTIITLTQNSEMEAGW